MHFQIFNSIVNVNLTFFYYIIYINKIIKYYKFKRIKGDGTVNDNSAGQDTTIFVF